MRKNCKRTIILKILIGLFKLSGLIPFSYVRSDKIYNENRGFLHYVSRASVVYNFFLIGIVIGMYIETVVAQDNFFWRLILVKPIGGMEVCTAGLISIMLWFVFFLNRNDVAETVYRFLELEDLLHNHYGSHWSKRNERKCAGMLLIYLVFLILTFWFFQYKKSDIPTTVVSMYLISKFIISMCLLKYSLMCLMIENIVRCLNTILSNFHKGPKQHNRRLEDLRNVRCLYSLVWDIREKMNEIFGIPILIIITCVSFGIIYIVAMIVTVVRRGEFDPSKTNIRPVYAVQFSVMLATYMLFWTTTRAVKEVHTQKFVNVLCPLKLIVIIFCWAV